MLSIERTDHARLARADRSTSSWIGRAVAVPESLPVAHIPSEVI
jgi:hypothetical protein